MNEGSIIAFFSRNGEIGYVIIREGELRRWGVKTIKGKRSGDAFVRKVEKALSAVISLAEQGVIVTERIRGTPHQGALSRVMPKVLKPWRKSGYLLYRLSLSAKT